jgi:D-alanyl-D-alanine carboxypeptidase/D-alanyl-D-alanine-endopeptidase (penicillin-binding protein 4)
LAALAALGWGSAAAAQAPAPIVAPAAAGEAWSGDDLAKLRADLDALLAAAPTLRGAHAGAIALDARTGATLYERDADDAFQPASTLKLIAGSAALDRLGPAFRFRTDVFVSRAREIVLRAGGDPLLTESDLDAAARSVAATGLQKAAGVSVDDSHFDRKPYAQGWTWDDFAYDYAARASAMALEENVVHLTIAPGAAPGLPAIVSAAPVATFAPEPAGCDARGSGVTVVPLASTGPVGSLPTADVSLGAGGCIEAVGSVPLGAPPQSIDAAISDPVLYAREAFVRALQAAGVTLDPRAPRVDVGAAARRPAPPASVAAWTHFSPPLGALLGPHFWIPSDNFVGELLLKELGVAASGEPGTTAAGIAFERTWLQGIGIDPASATLADGCGMSQYDRITPRALALILRHDWEGPYRQLVLDSLPVGAARGTIEGIPGTDAAGRVFAKTGSMMHVRGLAGYLATKRHGTAIFAFNVDDWLGEYPALATVRAQFLARLVDD